MHLLASIWDVHTKTDDSKPPDSRTGFERLIFSFDYLRGPGLPSL